MNDHTPGARFDHRTGQWFPTINGIDASPTTFEEARAIDIASQYVIKALVAQRNDLLAALKDLLESYESYVDVDEVINADIAEPVAKARAVLAQVKSQE